MTPEQELDHLRFVVDNQADTITRLTAELARCGQSLHIHRDLWEREVPPGWRCWRVKRRTQARHDALQQADGRSFIVEHVPVWEPAQLRVDAAGNTRPGYVCTHQLENGNGQCGGNVFELSEAVGNHSCCVLSDAARWRP